MSMTPRSRSKGRLTRRGLLAGLGAGALLTGCRAGAVSEGDVERRWPPQGRFLPVPASDGAPPLTLHYWTSGSGVPVVLIHGASGNLRDWTFRLGPAIGLDHRAIAFDRPGLGYSDRPDGFGADPRDQARALRAGARALGVERPVVVGHSLGAAVALAWALEFPGEPRGVVAVSSVAMPYRGLARAFGAIGLDRVAVALYAQHLKRSVETGGVERFLERVFRPQTPPPYYARHVGGPLALRADALSANSDDIVTLNDALIEMAPLYPQLETRVEVIHGAEDFIEADRQGIPLSETLPNARLTLLEGVGHMAHHARPDALYAAINRLAAL